MKINKVDSVRKQKSESKERKVPTGKSFHEFMATRKPPQCVQRKRSIFDMAGKKEEKVSYQKKNIKESTQHGAVQNQLSSERVVESHGVTKISELTSEMHELIEKMAYCVKVESQKGVTTTTVFIEMEGSVFNGSQVVIDHYDTAPQSFNLQLSGSPEAADLFAANLAALQASLQTHQTLKGFQIQLFPPALTEKSDLHLRSKGKEKKIFKKPPFGEKISF
jgi:hypothetical protein